MGLCTSYRYFYNKIRNKYYKTKRNFLSHFPQDKLRNQYLLLMQKCLIGTIYEDKPLPGLGNGDYDHNLREYGWDWPSMAHSMIGTKRMENLRELSQYVLDYQIPGDFIETGVWRGGSCIMMRAVLKANGITNRKVWVADSFEGLPHPDEDNYPEDKGQDFHTYKELAISLDEVKNNFLKYSLLDEQVVFLKGWFKETLPKCGIEKIAILRLDGDLYESTFQSLSALYSKVTNGGFVIIDDYHVVEGCKKAVHDFLRLEGVNPTIQEIDKVGVYWEKQL